MRPLAAALLFALATPAMAQPPHEEVQHGEEADQPHLGPGAGHAEEHHGEDAHHYFTADDDGDGTANWMDFDSDLFVVDNVGFHALNLALLIGLLWWFTRRPIADAVKNRALDIRKELTDSARARDEAHQRHQELAARLDKIEDEIGRMEAEAREEAAREEQKLVERAEREAVRIGETAQRNIRDEVTRARHELRAEAVELAVQLAENTLRGQVAAGDQQALARAFLESIRSGKEAAHG